MFVSRRLTAPALILCAGAVFLLSRASRAEEAADLCQRALALKHAGQPEASAAVYHRAIGLDPTFADAHWGLAWVRASQGRKAEAAAEFRQVLALVKGGAMAQEAAAALARLGLPPSEEGGPPERPPPPPPPAKEPPLNAAKRLLQASEAFRAIQLLGTIPARDPARPEAEALLAEAKRGRRKVRVCAAADQVLRRQPDWEKRLRNRLAFAAEQIGRQVEIDFVLVEVRPWERRLRPSDGLDLVEELEDAIPLDGAEAVVGFVAEEKEVEVVDGRPLVRGYTLGLSPCFTGYDMVAEVLGSKDGRQYRVPEEILRESLVHELGHLCGAVHVNGDSVMRAQGGAQPTYAFDPLNLEVMRACRWIDFRENLASLDEPDLQRMATVYAKLEAGPASDDGVHFYRAQVCTMLAQYKEAIAEYQQVLAASPQDAFTHYNLAELLYYQQKDIEQAKAHWKIAEAIGRPAWVADLARKALGEHPGRGAP